MSCELCALCEYYRATMPTMVAGNKIVVKSFIHRPECETSASLGRLILIVACSVWSILPISCGNQTNKPPAWLKSVDLTNLVSEARALASRGQEQGEWYWTGSSRVLPVILRSLGA